MSEGRLTNIVYWFDLYGKLLSTSEWNETETTQWGERPLSTSAYRQDLMIELEIDGETQIGVVSHVNRFPLTCNNEQFTHVFVHGLRKEKKEVNE